MENLFVRNILGGLDMIENTNSQDKLLNMLTEIYDQLEELESVLEYSLADLRSNIQKHHSDQLIKGEDKIRRLEQSIREHSSGFQENKENYHPSALKLELGF